MKESWSWQEEVIKLIQEHYKSVGMKYTPSTDIRRCLVDFMNLEMKIIKPVPRLVYRSKEITSRRIPMENRRALAYIENKIRSGADITFHQSKDVLNPEFNDLLLNDWVIHHLHLSDTKKQKNQRFYDRTKYVLFAIFGANQAFLIDIRTHGPNGEPHVFAKKELLEIIDRNWPEILKGYVHEEITALLHDPTDEQVDKFRKNGISFGMTEVNGKVIMNPGIGITTGGNNLHVVKRANEIIRYLQGSLMEIDKDEEGMRRELSERAGFEIKELDIRIHRQKTWPFFYVYEKNSDHTIEATSY